MARKNNEYGSQLSNVHDARAVRTRDSLRRTLLSLLEEKAIDQITVREIATTAGIGYATYFRHYASKESLLNDLVSVEIGELVALALPMVDEDRAKAASETLFIYVDKHRPLWTTFLTGGAASGLREEMLRIALAVAADRPQPGAVLPTELATRLIVSGTIEVLTWWLSQEKPPLISEAAALHVQYVVLPAIRTQQKSAFGADIPFSH